MQSALRLVLIAGLLLAPVGCSTNPATGKQSFTAFMSPAEEKRVGAEQHPKVVSDFGGAYEDPALAAYIDGIGQAVAKETEVPDSGYTFTVLDDDTVNAFALPGGYVHVTRGLLALASNEAEVAGVLAHELGHVVARHAAERYSQSVAAGIGVSALGVLGTVFGIPPIAGDLAGVGAQAYLQHYSRDQEMEADRLAIRYMTRAGYDPQAMVTFFRKLDADTRLQAELVGDPGAADRFNIMASHPRTADRLQQAISLAGGASAANERLGGQEYLAHIDGIIYGDAREDGFRRGRDFFHPDLGIAFRVPPGFVLQNSPKQVVAIGPEQSLIIFTGERPEVASQAGAMTNYLTRIWAPRANLENVEALTINGLEAATGTTRASTRQGMRDVRLMAIRTAPDQLYRFIFLSPPALTPRLAGPFKETGNSFRRLSAEETQTIRPLRIHITQVKAGDTVATLASGMPFPDYNAELFRVLNGLEGRSTSSLEISLAPGQSVKVVSDRSEKGST